ncbi:hypothetical protein I316_00648 [Kwoniella heveanensis BCC8398]|uniref:Metallo-beta-lactamase domain-containing protein n=1 Tax=Kwoniella heveanensis BCC8398 TaxID=1296120 RepID=A0A1B9H2M8_9TREE|nr:hypothetical protein I316_00648 [Kwoniella heveanensis BCC8398]
MSKFENPWSSFRLPGVKDLASSISVRSRQEGSPQSKKPVRMPTTRAAIFKPTLGDDDDVQAMWLGHASVYLRIPLPRGQSPSVSLGDKCRPVTEGRSSIGVLFDPVFSKRCSPVSWLGPKRRLKLPCCIQDLPAVNVVIISHDHYDHLDRKTIKEIERSHGRTAQCIVPTGVKKILVKIGVPAFKVHELAWWEEVVLPISTMKGDTPDAFLRLACTPAQHNSGRTPFGQNKTLWASWYLNYWVEGSARSHDQDFRCFFGGDTGYRSIAIGDRQETCPAFREIRAKYGSPDLTLLPIAAGSVLPYLCSLLPGSIKLDHYKLTSSIHASPRDALDMHADLTEPESQFDTEGDGDDEGDNEADEKLGRGWGWMMPIHYATFASRADTKDTSVQLEMACRERGVRHEWVESGLRDPGTKSMVVTHPEQVVVDPISGKGAEEDGEKCINEAGGLSPELAVITKVTGNGGVLVSDVGVEISIPLRRNSPF